MNKTVLNFDHFCKVVEEVEKVFKEYELNPIEKDLVLREIQGKMTKENMRRTTMDNLSSIPGMGFALKMLGGQEPKKKGEDADE